MPLVTVMNYLQQQIDGLNLPLSIGRLTAYIQPAPGADDGSGANAYVWGANLDEARETVPRAAHGNLASGGNKELTHRVNIWLVWFTDPDDPNINLGFPAIVDAVMAVYRNVEMLDQTQHAIDPITGQESNLLNVGEKMSAEYAPVRAVADQRLLRFDAMVEVEVIEVIQA